MFGLHKEECPKLVTCNDCGCAVFRDEAQVVKSSEYIGGEGYFNYYCRVHQKPYDIIVNGNKYYKRTEIIEVTQKGKFIRVSR